MKNKIIFLALFCGIYFISACSGDHPSHTGKDTVINTYHTAKDTSKMDTSKVISADNSATGGTGNTKDTVKKHSGSK